MRNADLSGADLRYANLRYADLSGADLRGATFDFSCFPLWCGSFNIKADDRLLAQLLAHIARFDTSEMDTKNAIIVKEIKERFGDMFCNYRNDIKKGNK